MSVSDVITRMVTFLRASYPHGVSPADTFASLVLSRRLRDEHVAKIAAVLIERGHSPVQATDIRVMITKVADRMPAPDDVDRVKQYLSRRGWSVSDEFPPHRRW